MCDEHIFAQDPLRVRLAGGKSLSVVCGCLLAFGNGTGESSYVHVLYPADRVERQSLSLVKCP